MTTLDLTADNLPVDDPGERALIDRARRDPEAFATLYRLHYPRIANYVHRRTGHAAATEDLVSDVFMTALTGLPRYRHRGLPFRAWLYRIATNAVNQWARRERRRLLREHRHAARPAPAPELDAHARDDVRRALLSIAPQHQAVLALHHLENLAVEQIALVLGRPPGTIKSRLHRARRALRDALQEKWNDA